MLSKEFESRLSRLAPDTVVQAVVVLNVGAVGGSVAGRLGRGRRREVARSVRKAGAELLVQIDSILACHNGRRLCDSPTALGTVRVETTPAGIRALAQSDQVKSVLEDQRIMVA